MKFVYVHAYSLPHPLPSPLPSPPSLSGCGVVGGKSKAYGHRTSPALGVPYASLIFFFVLLFCVNSSDFFGHQTSPALGVRYAPLFFLNFCSFSFFFLN